MPLLPLGLGKKTLDRVKKRLEQEISPIYERVKEELGQKPPPAGPTAPPAEPPKPTLPVARTPGAMEVMLREAVNMKPPVMVRALYQRKGAKTATWRYLQPVEMVAGRAAKDTSRPMLYAACEADGWKIEAFRLDRFEEMQLTNLPYAVQMQYPVKPETF